MCVRARARAWCVAYNIDQLFKLLLKGIRFICNVVKTIVIIHLYIHVSIKFSLELEFK